MFKKDVDALMRLYDPSVRVFDACGIWSYEGADAWQRAVEAWFTSLAAERVKVTFAEVQTSTGKDTASVSKAQPLGQRGTQRHTSKRHGKVESVTCQL